MPTINEQKEKILDRINIDDLYARYTEVVTRGKETSLAFCPFHNDKNTPNLQITITGRYRGRFHENRWIGNYRGKLSD